MESSSKPCSQTLQLSGANALGVLPCEPFERFFKEEVNQSIPDRFKKQVASHAGRIAVGTGATALTYGHLNGLANRIAREILSEQGEWDGPVALLLGRGPGALAAILGVLKAGRAFVPLDRTNPEARNRHTMEDAESRLILTDSGNLASAEDLAQRPVTLLNIDEIAGDVSEEDPEIHITPEAIAYILYTSGSSGRPKGVVQTHRNVLHCALRLTNDLHVSYRDRLTFLLSVTHSAGLVDFFGALMNGASLHTYDVKENGLGPLAPWLVENEITVCHMVPTLFRHFALDLPAGFAFPRLRVMKLSGEQVSKHEVDLFRQAFSRPTLLMNAFGATEINAVRHFFLNQTTEVEGSVVPAGYETEDTEVSILDDAGNEVQSGCLGEISIRSPFISPGYWRNPELTEATFQPDPERPGSRVYRTGDLGYLSADGCLFHLGRKDLQVKVRGQRVELAEIEVELLKHPDIKEAVVVARDGGNTGTQLVAFVVPRQGRRVPAREIRDSLADALPSFMVPSAFTFLSEIPQTATGKVDRKALLSLPDGDNREASECIPPRTPTEVKLVEMWSRLLGMDRIGVTEGFFDLGGHSLLAARMLAEIEESFGKRLPPSVLLGNPTVDDVACAIREGIALPDSPSMVPIQPNGYGLPFFCVDYIRSDGLGLLNLARHLGPNQSVYGLLLATTGREPLPERSVPEMASSFIRQIREIQPAGPYLLGGYSSGGACAFEMGRQLLEQGEEVALLVLFDSFRPDYLRRLPVRDYRIGDERRFELPGRIQVSHLPREIGRIARSAVVTGHRAITAGRRLGRLGHHLSAIRGMPNQMRWQYIAFRATFFSGKLADKAKSERARIAEMSKLAGAQVGNAVGRSETVIARAIDTAKPALARALLGRPTDCREGDPYYPILKAYWSYRPSPCAVRVTLLRAVTEGTRHVLLDRREGWAGLARGGFEVIDVPGVEHGAMMAEPYVGLTARKLRQLVDRVRAEA